jgi:hypothetical protein
VLKQPSPFTTKPQQQSQQSLDASPSQEISQVIDDEDEDDHVPDTRNDSAVKTSANENPWERLRRQSQQAPSTPKSQSPKIEVDQSGSNENNSTTWIEPSPENSSSKRYNQYGDEIL